MPPPLFPPFDTGQWGYPTSATGMAAFGPYVDAVATLGTSHIDVVLVDGRFRAACALKALWYIGDASIVMIHDFYGRWSGDNVQWYTMVLEFYDVIDRADTLAVLKRRPGLGKAGMQRARELLAKQMNIPD